ncbi:oxidoreductase [Actinobacteria bacterium YIM 96077]|uniref:Oxidoreductase n=1 Tax=Phytoactinopolyspora halophila TaxID=1981511 RepID=A0A329QE57_9ACTN|nr:molybdopterin-dependent oxidoreductase [Phytoactinopolyspora halophila]AYY15343.1 oxidoreductase [Actinobacteria bacterium YIM 96077]RAW10627.1 oxidoreductase [Phytoactinopolyspora halophila]
MAAAAGVVAGAVTLAAGELAGLLVGPRSGPFFVVGNTIVDLTPEWLKSFAISTFGENDKIALFACLATMLTLLAAIAGWLQLRRPPWGLVLVGILGAVAAVAALTRPGSDAWYVIPAIVAIVSGSLTLWLLISVLRERPEQPSDSAHADAPQPLPRSSRRRFLVLTVAAAGLAVAAAAGSRTLGQTRQDILDARARLRLPSADDPAAPPPVDAELDVPEITPFTTPNSEFYRVDTALEIPRLHPGEWRLRIHGMVDEAVEIDFDDLVSLPLVERMITLTCVSNEVGGELAGNAVWLGYPLRALLERARPHDDADMVLSTSVDGFTASTPLEALTDGRDALLAVGMNGEPLPMRHGFPVRMVVPGLYGYVSATKWVTDLRVTRFDRETAYWTDRGWAERAPIKTASRIDVPGSFARLDAGPNVVAGVAWAQRRGIGAVQVNVDDGEWYEAELAGEVSVDTWRQWFWEWDAEPGRHTVRVRAVDGDGALQTGEQVPPIPDGASGWHSVVVEVI